MSAYIILTHEYERLQDLRDKADAEWQTCLDRAEELHRYRGHLTEEMDELLSARGAVGAVLLAKRREEQKTREAKRDEQRAT